MAQDVLFFDSSSFVNFSVNCGEKAAILVHKWALLQTDTFPKQEPICKILPLCMQLGMRLTIISLIKDGESIKKGQADKMKVFLIYI